MPWIKRFKIFHHIVHLLLDPAVHNSHLNEWELSMYICRDNLVPPIHFVISLADYITRLSHTQLQALTGSDESRFRHKGLETGFTVGETSCFKTLFMMLPKLRLCLIVLPAARLL